MESKKTAVEWLEVQFEQSYSYINEIFKEAFEQAKQMEREQIEEAYGHGQNNGYMYANSKAITITKDQYYNQTYGE